MPGGDGTGPMGLGPMTGRAAGYCARYQVPGCVNPVIGRGFGRGGGWGRRNLYYATGLTGLQRIGYAYPSYGQTTTKQQELADLKNQAEYLEDAMNQIQKRIQELETEMK